MSGTEQRGKKRDEDTPPLIPTVPSSFSAGSTSNDGRNFLDIVVVDENGSALDTRFEKNMGQEFAGLEDDTNNSNSVENMLFVYIKHKYNVTSLF